jgi:hypothetical protein
MSRTDLEHRFPLDPWVPVGLLLRRNTEDEEEEEDEEDDENKDETDDEDEDDEGEGYSVCPRTVRRSSRIPGPTPLDR